MNLKKKIDLELENKLRELICAGKKVEAVAAVQSKMKIGLKNSKDIVDELEESLNLRLNTTDSLT